MTSTRSIHAPVAFLKVYAVAGALAALSVGWILATSDARGWMRWLTALQCVVAFLFFMMPALLAGTWAALSREVWSWGRIVASLAFLYAVWGSCLLITRTDLSLVFPSFYVPLDITWLFDRSA